MADTIEVVCKVCGTDFSETAPVYCSRCDVPHHEDCWRYVGQCSIFGCGCKTFVSSLDPADGAKERDRALAIPRKTKDFSPQGRLALRYSPSVKERTCFTVNPSQQANGICRTKDSQLVQAASTDDILVHRAFKVPFTRLDIDTELELILSGASFVATVIIVFVYPFAYRAGYGVMLGVLSFLALCCSVLRMFVDCTYVLDNERRCLFYSSSVFGFSSDWLVCSFDDIDSVAISSDSVSAKGLPLHQIQLKLRSGAYLPITEGDVNGQMVSGFAANLAFHLGVKKSVIKKSELGEESLPVKQIEVRPLVVQWRSWPVLGRPGIIDIVILLFSATVFFGLFF